MVEGRKALAYGTMKKPFGLGADQKRIHGGRPCRFSLYRYVVGVSAKRRDIVLHPAKRHQKITQTGVGGGFGQGRVRKKTKKPYAIVGRYYHGTLASHCFAAI